MNCPRCDKELVAQGNLGVCGTCRVSVALVEEKAALAQVSESESTPDTSNEIDPDEVLEESASAEVFPEEDNQESEEAKE